MTIRPITLPTSEWVQCEHCGSPCKQEQCRWWWWHPNAAACKRAGIDPPCVDDEYDQAVAERGRRRRGWWAVLAAIAMAIVGFGWWIDVR